MNVVELIEKALARCVICYTLFVICYMLDQFLVFSAQCLVVLKNQLNT
jgi:hypothetical protein